MIQALRIVFNYGFVVLLFMPLLVFIVTPVKEISLSENRKLAKAPQWQTGTQPHAKFTKQFESYWNDHFGLRETLVAWNSALHQKLFNKSPVTKVIKGENGWLFINLHSIVSDFLGLHPPAANTLQRWTTTLEQREQWLTRQNIKYVLLPIPSKMNVYHEHLPARYNFFRRGDNTTTLQHLFNHLEKNSNFTGAVQLTSLYAMEKSNNLLYFKTDTHWTWQGAYLAYGEVIKKLQTWYPEIRLLPQSSLELQPTRRNGDLARMIGAKTVVPEVTNTVHIKNSCGSKMFKLPDHNPAETKRHPMVTTCERAELTAVVTYDSFGAFLFPYYSEHFRRVTYVSRHDSRWLKSFLQHEKPDVFIHQRAARRLGELLNDDWELSQELK